MWHGPALHELLRDVAPPAAAAHPITGAHSIWELVLHMTVWAEIARSRIDGRELEYPPKERDWPAPPHPSEERWNADVAKLHAAYRELASAALALDGEALDRPVGTDQYTLATLLHGVIEHGCYHGGQIALLTRAQRAAASP